ncbi:MAG: antibiotic biosynthesis monooxygenase family protein [Cyanobacteria bacterium P01_A01_bin.116]
MIIVSGKIYVIPGKRDTFIEGSIESIKAARRAKGCRAFVVGPDVVEADRVNIYEEWDSKEDLSNFRGSGLSSGISSLIKDANVSEHYIKDASPDS